MLTTKERARNWIIRRSRLIVEEMGNKEEILLSNKTYAPDIESDLMSYFFMIDSISTVIKTDKGIIIRRNL